MIVEFDYTDIQNSSTDHWESMGSRETQLCMSVHV